MQQNYLCCIASALSCGRWFQGFRLALGQKSRLLYRLRNKLDAQRSADFGNRVETGM